MGRKIPMWQILLIVASLIGLICYSIFFSYGEIQIPMLGATLIASVIALLNGWKWSVLERGILSSINSAMQVNLMLLLVGILLGTWKAAGIIPTMIYYGLDLINPDFFLVTVCIVCSLVSIVIGSSYTTVGTLGVAMLGVAVGLGISPAMAAGAIISGSYFGDKMSPMSDTTNLASGSAGSKLFEHIKHMVYTVTPAYVITLIVYLVIGRGDTSADVSVGMADLLQSEILNEFFVSPVLLLPVVILIGAILLKIPAIPSMVIGALAGVVTMAVAQGVPAVDWYGIIHYGYASISETALTSGYTVADILGGGGLDSMLWAVSVVICAMCFSGVFEGAGMLATVSESILKVAKSAGALIVSTNLTCILLNILCAEQYLSIIVPGRMFKRAYEDKHLKHKNLSRCLEDSATLTSCLIPWCGCGIVMTGFLGVATIEYAPYAILNWLCPIISIIYGLTGFTIEKMSDEEYEEVMKQRELELALAEQSLQG